MWYVDVWALTARTIVRSASSLDGSVLCSILIDDFAFAQGIEEESLSYTEYLVV